MKWFRKWRKKRRWKGKLYDRLEDPVRFRP